jgi:hypothetical protein
VPPISEYILKISTVNVCDRPIIESPDCPCGGGSQTVDHLIFDCTILQDERERLIGKISRHDNWPVTKSQMGNKYIKYFRQFTNSINFKKL